MTQNSSVNPSEGHLPASSKEIFASAYLTLASIIQGVALAALVQRVESTYESFDAVAWVMTAGTLIAIIVIWHEYLMMVLAVVFIVVYAGSSIPYWSLIGRHARRPHAPTA